MKLIASLVLLLFSFSARANEASLTKAMSRARHTLASQGVEREKVLRSLYKIGRQTQSIVYEKSKLEQEKIGVEAQIKILVTRIRENEVKLKDQRSSLLVKLNSIHRFSSQAWTQFLLQAKNSAQLERNVKYLSLISQHDLGLLKEYSTGVQEYSRQKQKFTDRLAYLNNLEKEIDAKEKNLREQNDLRSKILAQLKSSQLQTIQRLHDLQVKQGKSSALAESGLLDSIDGVSFFERRGQLSPPIEGLIAHGYGLVRDKTTSALTSHRGWFYSSPVSSRVRVIFDGQVVHTEYIPEYGQTLVVDHGDHFYSVYSSLSQINVKEGDSVKEGKVIGLTGTSPFDGKTGLYFEIRHFSETVDPKSWMKGRSYEISESQWNR